MIYKRIARCGRRSSRRVATLSRARCSPALICGICSTSRGSHTYRGRRPAIQAEQCKLIEGLGIEPSGWLELGAGAARAS